MQMYIPYALSNPFCFEVNYNVGQNTTSLLATVLMKHALTYSVVIIRFTILTLRD